ncbi:Ap2 domain containing protein [Musa troglodytarum]|uniref:Ap2 domain containing protein n=1 Tax=Musa troglodytarum TaxID=320322 RepID=A0A9E7HJS5_9LILI|nr:Ap2 domain containing protein [Musa troglodytarum]
MAGSERRLRRRLRRGRTAPGTAASGVGRGGVTRRRFATRSRRSGDGWAPSTPPSRPPARTTSPPARCGG